MNNFTWDVLRMVWQGSRTIGHRAMMEILPCLGILFGKE